MNSTEKAASSIGVRMGYIASFLISLVIFLGAAGLGLEMAMWGQFVPLIWPPAGIALFLVFRLGYRFLAVVFLGEWMIQWLIGFPLWLGALDGLGYLLALGLAVWILRRLQFNHSLETMRDVSLFVGIGAIMPALISGLVATISLHINPVFSSPGFLELFGMRWLGDVLGVVTVCPALFVWSSQAKTYWRNRQSAEVLLWLATLIFVGGLVFRNWAPSHTLRYPLELSMFPIFAWAAIRFGQRGISAGIMVVAILTVLELREVVGPDPTRTITQPPSYLWAFVSILALTALFLGAAMTEARQRELKMQRGEARQRAILKALPDPVYLLSEEGEFLEVHHSPTERRGIPLAVGDRVAEAFPDLAATIQEKVRRCLTHQSVQRFEYDIETEAGSRAFEGRIAPLLEDSQEPESAVVWVAFDITRRKDTEETLLRRDRLLYGVTRAETALFTVGDFSAAIQRALRALGESIGVDRIVLAQNHVDLQSGERHLLRCFQWAIDTRFALPLEGPEARIRYEYGDDLHTFLEEGVSAVLPNAGWRNDSIEAKMLLPEIETTLLTPILRDNELWGLLSICCCRKNRPWAEGEKSAVESFAASLGGFLSIKHKESELKAARDLANSANLAKSEFLAIMSHEIRTPMNAILGFADLLSQTAKNDDQREYIRIITRGAKDLLELINNILDYSKLESTQIQLERKAFKLEDVIVEVLELVLQKAQEKGLHLDYRIEGDSDAIFLGDIMRIRRIILNLVSNAVKFTPDGEVMVTAMIAPRDHKICDVSVAVRDSGIGIAEVDLKRLFKPFSQIDSSSTRAYGGTGLGLVICQRLAERMGGGIEVESQENEGSTFTVHLPLQRGRPEQAAESSEMDNFADDSFSADYPLRILLIEDEGAGKTLLVESLATIGYRADWVETAEAVGTRLRRARYDAILVDVKASNIDGVELLQRISGGKFGSAAQRAYLIAVTSLPLPEEKETVELAGALEYLARPVSIRTLKAVLARAYGRVTGSRD